MRFYLGHPWPKSPEELPELLRCIDYELCKTLIDSYPLPVLEIPVCGRLKARNRMIIKLSDRGWSLHAIAKRFNLSVRMIRRILSARTEFDDLGTLS
jgi:DNA-binding NarL/FixJ family response regulator